MEQTELVLKFGLLGWKKELTPDNLEEFIRWLRDSYDVKIIWETKSIYLYHDRSLLMIYSGRQGKDRCSYIIQTILPDILRLWWSEGDSIYGPDVEYFGQPREWT